MSDIAGESPRDENGGGDSKRRRHRALLEDES